MLRTIHIQDFAIIENVTLALQNGMTVITGETGAGKSIVIDALDIALGDKASPDLIRYGQERCEICVEFEVHHIPKALAWLTKNELAEDNVCIIRRVLPREGRSRNFVNGRPVTIAQLQEIGTLLINVHGQHQHQALMKIHEQREVLDNYANHDEKLQAIKQVYYDVKKIEKEIEELTAQTTHQEAQKILMHYQLQELIKLNLAKDELEQLHEEQKRLSHADNILAACQQALEYLQTTEGTNAVLLTHFAKQHLESIRTQDVRLVNIEKMLDNALINLQEAQDELENYVNGVEQNPARLQEVESRLSEIHTLARKFKIPPENLLAYQQTLEMQFNQVEQYGEKLTALSQAKEQLWQSYSKLANDLHKARQASAKTLNHMITESMQSLGMQGGVFAIEISENEPSLYGTDKVEFYVSTNPGHPLQPLSKVVSGGELSRISLLLQLIISQHQSTPSLVFDEVDVGIGGKTAAIVGQLLRKLSQTAQVLCITHLPQVASQGHHHLSIRKISENEKTYSEVRFLNEKERVEEIARMLGGVKMTAQSLAHAKEMLCDVS